MARYDVTSFGAVPDGVTDSYAAINAAINAAVAAGHGEVYVPTGKYSCSNRLSFSLTGKKDIVIRGAGQDVSIIMFTTANNGFGIGLSQDEPDDSTKLIMEDITLASSVSGGTAIHVNGNFSTGMTAPGAEFNNVTIRGDSIYQGFTNGIIASNSCELTIDGCNFLGDADSGVSNGVGVWVDGQLNSPTDHYITKSRFYWYGKAIYITGTAEGVTVDTVTVVGGLHGVLMDVGGEPLLNVTNSHFNTGEYGIYGKNIFQSMITNNLIYQNHSGAQWSGIALVNGEHCTISGNMLHGWNYNVPRSGIVLDGITHHCTVFGNIATGHPSLTLQTGIKILSTAHHNEVYGNTFDGVATPVSNGNSTNRLDLGATSGSAGNTVNLSDGYRGSFRSLEGYKTIWGTHVATTDGSSRAYVPFQSAFGTCHTVVVCSGDANAGGGQMCVDGWTNNGFYIRALNEPNQAKRINYVAIGQG